MGKPSLFSRNTSRKRRQQRHKLRKEIEIGDVQIQLNDYKKDVEASKEKVIEQMNKLCRENENLLKWIDVYAKQIEIQKKRNYDLELKLYAQQSSSSSIVIIVNRHHHHRHSHHTFRLKVWMNTLNGKIIKNNQ